jgi:hypothetical protein
VPGRTPRDAVVLAGAAVDDRLKPARDKLTTPQLLLTATCVYTVALVTTVYLTRACPWRLVGAIAGGGACAVVGGVGVEVLCQTLGFWRYPSTEARYGPTLMYPLLVLAFATLALIGWRVTRRFGRRGQAVFLAAVMVIGTLRDYLVAGQVVGLIVLAPGVVTVLVDAACWGGLTALAQAVMRLIAGPAQGDQLARRPWETTG